MPEKKEPSAPVSKEKTPDKIKTGAVPEKDIGREKKKEILVKKTETLQLSKVELQKKRNAAKEIAEGKKANQDDSSAFEGWDSPGVIPSRPDQEIVKKVDFDRSQRELREQEIKTLDALKEKHAAEIEDVIFSFDLSKTDSKTQQAVYYESLRTSVDIHKIDLADRQKALEGLTNPDGTEIDVNKLTPEQQIIVQTHQTKRYLGAIKALSESERRDPEKVKKFAQSYLGLEDFSDKKISALLSEDAFLEQAQRDPTILRGFIDSVKQHGFLASGINPDTDLGKSLVKISQGNIDEYISLFPQETDIRKFADILGGSYADILAQIPFSGLEKFQDSLKTVRSNLKSGELGGISREDFKTEQEFQDAANKASKEATGMGYGQMTKMVNKAKSSSNIHPTIRFLADLLAPLGAMFNGETGDFWREYLRQGNGGKDVSGGGFDSPGQKFDKLKSTTPDVFLGAATKYLGWPYRYGADGSSREKGIDCSQLVVNSLIDVGCLPNGFDTTATGFAQRSHRIGDTQGKKGDFLIMGAPSPHIAIIAEDPAPGSNTYKTIEAASGKGGVVYTQRTAGKSFQVYRNPFFEGNDITQNKQGTERFEIAGTPITVTPPANPKNLSDRNKNPLNIKSSRFPGDSKGHSICPSYEAGITIAVEDLQKKLNGQSEAVRRYTGGRNALYVRDVIGTWAPESDGNDPDGYTNYVLSRMGFSGDLQKIPVSAVQNRIPELVVQMAKMEGCQATFQFGGAH